MDVRIVPFTDLLQKIVDNRGRTCPVVETGFPLIATNCIRNNLLYPAFENVRYVSEDTHKTWFRGHPEPGDIIFVCKGTPGRVCLTPDPVSFCIAQDMVAVRADPRKIYPRFLFALLRSPTVQRQIENMHVGTLIPHFKKGDFDKLMLPVPDAKTQQAIGDMYFELSAAIDCNQRTNQTLDAIARTLFKSWFVDFDPVHAKANGRVPPQLDSGIAALFPSNLEFSGRGQIPKGWRWGAYGQGLSVTKGRSYKSDELQDSPVALVTLKSFLRGGGYRPDGLKPFTGPYAPEQIVRNGDLIVAFTDVTQAADVIGKPARVRGNPTYSTLVASLDVGIVRPHAAELPVEYLYYRFLSQDFQDHTYAHANGSTVLHLAPNAVAVYEGIWPSPECAAAFREMVVPLHALQELHWTENERLTDLRDALLPRLLSGEVRLRDAERVVGAAV